MDRNKQRAILITDIPDKRVFKDRKTVHRQGESYVLKKLPNGAKPYRGRGTDWEDVNGDQPFSVPRKKKKVKTGRKKRICTECGSPFTTDDSDFGCVSCGNTSKRKTKVRPVTRTKRKVHIPSLVHKAYNIQNNNSPYGGDGYFQIYYIGGGDVEYFFKGFIHQEDQSKNKKGQDRRKRQRQKGRKIRPKP